MSMVYRKTKKILAIAIILSLSLSPREITKYSWDESSLCNSTRHWKENRDQTSHNLKIFVLSNYKDDLPNVLYNQLVILSRILYNRKIHKVDKVISEVYMSKHVITCMSVYISHDKVAKSDKLIILWEAIVCLQ